MRTVTTISESLPASKGTSPKVSPATVGAEQGEFSVFLPLLQPQLAFEQDPESPAGLIDIVEIGASLGVDELHRTEALKVLYSNAGEDRHLLQLSGKTCRLDLLHSRT